MASAPTQIADGVHRLGDDLVNFYLVDDGGRLTIVDAGLPAHRSQLESYLPTIGRTLADVEAVILTHAHMDHVGIADGVRRDAGAPVYVHEADANLARTGKNHKRDGSLLPYLRYPATWKLLAMFVRAGAAKPPKIAEVTTFGSDAGTLEVPGRPRVIPTPGHSPGHVAFHLPERGVLFAGDAMCTYNPMTGRRGPQVMPKAFALSAAQELESLSALEQLEASLLLPGHGEPWTDGPAAAVARAREVGET
jgi:glyoxylase-like metal-dependent hydrolase (beta-lactamase superfamily II)